MACTNCITYRFTNDEGIGLLEFIAEDPNGLTLEVQSITLFTFTDSEGEVTAFEEGFIPDWLDFEAVGVLVSVGGLYRITLTLYFDFFAANEAEIGPGTYTGRVCFKRSDGSFDNLCCDFEVCSEGIEAGEEEEEFVPNTIFVSGSADQGRLLSCDYTTGNLNMTTIISGDPHPGIPYSNALWGCAFHNNGQKIYFTSSAPAYRDQIWRCDPDGSNCELYHDFDNGDVIRPLHIHVDGDLLYAGTTEGWIYRLNLNTGAVSVVWSQDSGLSDINSLDTDDEGNLFWSTRNAAGDTAIWRYDGEVVESLVGLAIQDDLPTLRYNRNENELWGSDDTAGAGVNPIGVHVWDMLGTYLREESDISFLGTANDFVFDTRNGYIIYIGGATPDDVFRIDLSNLAGSAAKVGDVTGATGSILQIALGYVEPEGS